MIALPDVNVLVAIAWPSHMHHGLARSWFEDTADSGWATSPQTEHGFLRVCMNAAVVPRPTTAREAIALIASIRRVGNHAFWSDETSADDLLVVADAIQGYRQVPDAHLLALAGRHGGVVATLDGGLAQLASSPRAAIVIS